MKPRYHVIARVLFKDNKPALDMGWLNKPFIVDSRDDEAGYILSAYETGYINERQMLDCIKYA